jgi:hypothetical protein
VSDFDVLTCADCGAVTLRRGPTQVYCVGCSSARDRARKALWAARHPQEPREDAYERQQSAVVARGVELSVENRGTLAYEAPSPALACAVRVAVPFDWASSKNAVWRTGRGGHVYARKEATAFRESLASRIRDASRVWFQGKVWIDIFVEKPNHRGDAINVIDLVCDAIKDAIGVDDRWYSIRSLDWAIVKENPRIIVGIGQDVTEDHQVCSHCGRALVLNEFGMNRSRPNGRARVCKDCSAPRRGRKAAA